MKKIIFNDNKENGFTINNINNDILITSFGYSHLFNYPKILTEEIKKISKKINKDEINIYFDLSSVLDKNASNKYFTIIYSKTKKDFIYSSKNTLTDFTAIQNLNFKQI